jgi:hypothetical protein
VGSFFGGGFFPGIGLPLPPPPPPVLRYDNVPVLVRYSDRVYEPFRVRRIVDVGDDVQFGERKVLLDGATPACGRKHPAGNGNSRCTGPSSSLAWTLRKRRRYQVTTN